MPRAPFLMRFTIQAIQSRDWCAIYATLEDADIFLAARQSGPDVDGVGISKDSLSHS